MKPVSTANVSIPVIFMRGGGSGAPASHLIRGIDAVEPTEQPRPYERAPAAAGPGGGDELRVGVVDDLLGHRDQLPAARLRPHLDRARGFQVVHRDERLGDRLAHGQEPVVAQDQRGLVAEVSDETRLLVVSQRRALEVVIPEAREHGDRMLREGQQARALGRHGHAVQGVGMEDALGVVSRGVDRAVNHEAGGVHGKRRVLHLVALQIDLDQAGRRDLVEEQPVRVDEELVGGARHPRRDVREHQVLPAEVRHEPVAGSQIDAHRPFFRRHLPMQF